MRSEERSDDRDKRQAGYALLLAPLAPSADARERHRLAELEVDEGLEVRSDATGNSADSAIGIEVGDVRS